MHEVLLVKELVEDTVRPPLCLRWSTLQRTLRQRQIDGTVFSATSDEYRWIGEQTLLGYLLVS